MSRKRFPFRYSLRCSNMSFYNEQEWCVHKSGRSWRSSSNYQDFKRLRQAIRAGRRLVMSGGEGVIIEVLALRWVEGKKKRCVVRVFEWDYES